MRLDLSSIGCCCAERNERSAFCLSAADAADARCPCALRWSQVVQHAADELPACSGEDGSLLRGWAAAPDRRERCAQRQRSLQAEHGVQRDSPRAPGVRDARLPAERHQCGLTQAAACALWR